MQMDHSWMAQNKKRYVIDYLASVEEEYQDNRLRHRKKGEDRIEKDTAGK